MNGRSDAALGVLLAAAVTMAVAAVNVYAAPDAPAFLGMLAIGPFVAAAFAPARPTAAVGLLATGLALLLGAGDGMAGSFEHVFRAASVGVASAFAVWVAHRRQAIQSSLVEVQRVAEVVQEAILAPIDETVGGVEVATRYQSAASEAVVGGDFYDLVETAHGLRLVIGDVRGKGLPAVQLSARALGAFRAAAHTEPQLGAVVKAVETILAAELGDEEFVTMLVVGLPGDGRMLLANCGHPAPLRWRDGAVQALAPASPCPPLGLGASPPVDEHELEAGDRLLLYTDGIVEARDRRGEFFDLASVFGSVAGADPAGTLDRLVSLVQQHCHGALDDDVALVLAAPVRP